MPVERQREYETVYILRPNATDEERTKAQERFDDWGLRKLAYEIRDRGNAEYHDRGRYQYYRYVAPADTIAEIERNLRIVDAVIKYLTVKIADNLIAADRVAEGVVDEDLDVFTPAVAEEEE